MALFISNQEMQTCITILCARVLSACDPTQGSGTEATQRARAHRELSIEVGEESSNIQGKVHSLPLRVPYLCTSAIIICTYIIG